MKAARSPWVPGAGRSIPTGQHQIAVRLIPHLSFHQPGLLQQAQHLPLVGDGVVSHDPTHGTVELVDCLAAGGVANDQPAAAPQHAANFAQGAEFVGEVREDSVADRPIKGFIPQGQVLGVPLDILNGIPLGLGLPEHLARDIQSHDPSLPACRLSKQRHQHPGTGTHI